MNSTRCQWIVVVGATLTLAAGAAGAQRPDSSARRDSVPRDSLAARAQRLQRVEIIGTLAPAATATPGIARTVITRAELDAEPQRVAVDPLRKATGVYIDEANGPIGPTIIRIRGGEEQFTQIVVDGMSVNENGGYYDWHGLTLLNVDRVEIARGPQSAEYGTSAMSGAVRIVTRAGESGSAKSELSVEGANTSPSGSAYRGTFESRGGTDMLRWSYGLGAAYDRGMYALPNHLHSADGSLRMDWLPTPTLAFTGALRYMSAGSLLPVRNPGVTRSPLDPNSSQRRDRTVGSLEATWAPSDRWTHRLSAATYHLIFTFDDIRDSVGTFTFFFFNFNYHSRSVLDRTTVRYVGTLALSPGANSALSLSYGADWEKEILHVDATGDFGPSTQDFGRIGMAAFGEAQLRYGDRWSFVGGARVQKYAGVGIAVVPRVTATYALVPHEISLRAAAASGFTAPNIQVQSPSASFVANPDLKSETSTSFEAGIDMTGTRAGFSATLFTQSYDNLVRTVPYDATRTINRNVGQMRNTGIEIEGTYRLTKRATAGATFSLVGTELVENSGLNTAEYPSGQPLPFRPDYTGSAWVTLPLIDKVTATLRVSAVGPQVTLSERFRGSRIPIDGYQNAAATVTWNASPAVDLYLHAENLANADYQVTYDKPGPPRSVAVGMRWRLGGGS